MLVERRVENSQVSLIQFKQFSELDLREILELFKRYQQENVILNLSFEDNIWNLNNETITRKINFNLDEVLYSKELSNRALFLYKDIILALKSYILYKLDILIVSSISAILNSIKKIIIESRYFNLENLEKLSSKKIKEETGYFKHLHHLIEFLEFFSINIENDYINLFYYQAESYNVYQEGLNRNLPLNQRDIGDFQSIFELDLVINLFWDYCSLPGSEELKEEFYPIKLWWDITTIIPLRVTEFVLTPYDCIFEKDGNYYLIVRRTELKKKSRVYHNIENDYILKEVRITRELYQIIDEYRKMVDDYDFFDDFYYKGYKFTGRRKFLLSHRSYFKLLRFKGATGPNTSILEFLNYANINYLLKQFYKRIVVDQFKYSILPKGQIEAEKKIGNKERELLPYELEYTNLGDTRHFAFINMALNDVEPLLMKEISGHSSISSSYHYYSHVDKFVKCFTYSMAKRIARKEQAKRDKEIINYTNSNNSKLAFHKVFGKEFEENSKNYREVEGGKCSSKQKTFEDMMVARNKYKEGTGEIDEISQIELNLYSDCRKSGNECGKSCEFFHPTQTKAQEDIKNSIIENQQRINTEAKALQELVKSFNKVQNFNGEFKLKINKIKTIANQNILMLSRYFL